MQALKLDNKQNNKQAYIFLLPWYLDCCHLLALQAELSPLLKYMVTCKGIPLSLLQAM